MEPNELQKIATISAIASAFSAFLSFAVGFFALRIAKNGLHSNVSPMLILEYRFGEKKLRLKNIGAGPALNIRLQYTQVHDLNTGKLVSYTISANQQRTLFPNDEGAFMIEADKAIDDQDLALVLADFNLFRFIDSIGKHKVVGIVFDDTHGRSYISRFKFVEHADRQYSADLLSIKRHGLMYVIFDKIDFYRYRLFRSPRQYWHEHIKSQNTKGNNG